MKVLSNSFIKYQQTVACLAYYTKAKQSSRLGTNPTVHRLNHYFQISFRAIRLGMRYIITEPWEKLCELFSQTDSDKLCSRLYQSRSKDFETCVQKMLGTQALQDTD